MTADVPANVALHASSQLRPTVLAIAGVLALILLGGLVLVVFTLRERRRGEVLLRENEERTRSILEAATDAFVSMDASGRITGWNRQAETTFGWSRSEVMGRSVASTLVPPEQRAAHEKGLRHFLETGEGPLLNNRIETVALHREGHSFPVALALWAVGSGDALLPVTLDEHGGDTQRGDGCRTRVGALRPRAGWHQRVEVGSVWVVMSRRIPVGTIAW